MIEIEKQQLFDLLMLAEEALSIQYQEFSNSPTDEDRELMLSMYRLAGKEVPDFFQRTFQWSQ